MPRTHLYPRFAQCAAVASSAGAFVTTTSRVLRPAHPGHARAGELAGVGEQHDFFGRLIIARLTGTSTTVVSITWPSGRTPLVPRKSQSACTWRRLSSVRKPTSER